MAKDQSAEGPAVQVLRAFTEIVDGGSIKPFSRRRPNWTVATDAVDAVLTAIIRGRVKFEIGDWKTIHGLVGGRWGSDRVIIGADGGEDWYRLACVSGNASAAASFEHAIGRQPFRVRPIDSNEYGRGAPLDRLYVGASFRASDNAVWVVTSFRKDNTIIVCRYTEGREAPVSRKRIDHAGLQALIGQEAL